MKYEFITILQMHILCVVLALSATKCSFGQPPDDSWSNWAGPKSNFSASVDHTIKFSKSPQKMWEQKIGNGHSAVVTNGQFCICHFSTGKTEHVQKFDLESGKSIWKTDFNIDYQSRNYPGPHATPALVANRVVVATINGVVRCLDSVSGSEVWSVDLRDSFGTKLPQSGYASSPLIHGDLVVVPTLGESQGVETEDYRNPTNESPPGMVALDLSSGTTVWQTESFRSSHASAIFCRIDGQPTICLHGMFELVGIDPASGKILWSHLLRKKAADNVSFTPLWDSDQKQLLISHGYCNKGTQAIGVSFEQGEWLTKLNWVNRDLRTVHTNAVILDHTIIGTNRDPANVLVGIDCRTGTTVFRRRAPNGKANYVRVKDRLIEVAENGFVSSGAIGQNGFAKSFSIQFCDARSWTIATVAGEYLLCRGGEKLFAFKFQSTQ